MIPAAIIRAASAVAATAAVLGAAAVPASAATTFTVDHAHYVNDSTLLVSGSVTCKAMSGKPGYIGLSAKQGSVKSVKASATVRCDGEPHTWSTKVRANFADENPWLRLKGVKIKASLIQGAESKLVGTARTDVDTELIVD